MKLIISIPTGNGCIEAPCALSLLAMQHLLVGAGIDYDVHILSGCPYLSVARNTMAAWMLEDTDATDQLFIDSDIGFDESKVLEILKRPEGIVAGIYPLKKDVLEFPVQIRKQDGVPMGRNGLIEGELLPTGFMRIKRGVYERMAEAHPELKYDENVVGILDGTGERGRALTQAYDFFGFGPFGRKFRTEDYAFCQRWRDLGGTVWVYPDVDFVHIGRKAYKGNFHEHLLRLPGGAKDGSRIAGALNIEGWMKTEELLWLAFEAQRHSLIVEVGSHLGRSTHALASNTSGTVWAIDDWNGPRDTGVNWPDYQPEQLYATFLANLQPFICSNPPKVAPIRADHGDVDKFIHLRPDMVFLDGSHDYESVKRDILFWRERLEPGGLLCGHDANWPGVREALAELLPEARSVTNATIWCYHVPIGKESDAPIPETVSQR